MKFFTNGISMLGSMICILSTILGGSVIAQNTGEKILMSLSVSGGNISDSVNTKNIISLNGQIDKDGDAIEFNGENSWISTAKPAFASNNIPFKIELRLKTTSETNQAVISGIYGKSTSIMVGINRKKVTFTTYNKSVEVLKGNTEIADGLWHDVVVTYKNGTKEIYVDGKLDASEANVSISGKTDGWRIGKQSELYPIFFKGQVSSVKISAE